MSVSTDAPAGQPPQSATGMDDTDSKLSLEKHLKLLDEKKKVQADRDAMAAKVAEYEAKEREREDEAAKKRGDFEARIKSRDEELAKEREKRLALETRMIIAQKVNAVIDALGGNLDPKWTQLIDVKNVELHPETGEIDANSVAKVADTLKKVWPEMVKGNGSRLPADAPQGNAAGKITRAEWNKLSSKEMIAKRHLVVD